MIANARLFWIIAVFAAFIDVVYVVWTLAYASQDLAQSPNGAQGGPVEWAGTVALGLVSILAALIAFYLGRSARAIGGVLPQDNESGNIDDGDPEQGFFSPWSWWPVTLAGGAAFVFLGIAVGVWICFFGAIIGVIGLTGWIYEYYRGYAAH